MMPELIVLNHLKNALDVPVFMERPASQKVESYVLVELVGGDAENFLRFANFAIQSYAPTLYKASVLNNRVMNVMTELIKNNEVTKVKLNSYYNFTDPDTKEYRYQAIYNLVLFGE